MDYARFFSDYVLISIKFLSILDNRIQIKNILDLNCFIDPLLIFSKIKGLLKEQILLLYLENFGVHLHSRFCRP